MFLVDFVDGAGLVRVSFSLVHLSPAADGHGRGQADHAGGTLVAGLGFVSVSAV